MSSYYKNLTYSGELKIDPPLSQDETDFLNIWQDALLSRFYNLCEMDDHYKSNKNHDTIFEFFNHEFTKPQKWLLKLSASPFISFENDKIVVSGTSEKGQFRDALLLYHHFFFSENPFFSKYLKDFPFSQERKFNGVIEAFKESKEYGNLTKTSWCYVAENSAIHSVDAKTIDEYQADPESFLKTLKVDKSSKLMDEYFAKNSPLFNFLALDKSLPSKSVNSKKGKI